MNTIKRRKESELQRQSKSENMQTCNASRREKTIKIQENILNFLTKQHSLTEIQENLKVFGFDLEEQKVYRYVRKLELQHKIKKKKIFNIIFYILEKNSSQIGSIPEKKGISITKEQILANIKRIRAGEEAEKIGEEIVPKEFGSEEERIQWIRNRIKQNRKKYGNKGFPKENTSHISKEQILKNIERLKKEGKLKN